MLAAMETLVRELGLTLRAWRRHAMAMLTALGALAAAVAAVTAVFSIVSGVLLEPLPYRDPGRLVMLWQDMRAAGGPARDWISPGLFVEWQQRATSLEDLAAVRGWQPNLTGQDEPERLRGAAVTHTYFSALGVAPALGRTFGEADDVPGGPAQVVLAHGLWLRRFGGNPRVVGEAILLDGQAATVIGVMPPAFEPAIVDAEIWSPLRINPAAAPRGMVVLRALGRLKPGLSLAQARADMTGVAARLAAEDPEWERARTVLVPLHEDLAGPVRPALLVLSAAVLLVTLIASANLSSLLLARATERARELAVRAALGAGRWHVLRSVLVEAGLLAVISCAGGALLGWWALRGLIALAPPSAPRLQQVQVDGTALLVTAGAAIVSVLIASLAPAAAVRRQGLTGALRDGGREASGSGRVRSALLVFEVAVAIVLVAGATLLTRTLIALQRVDLGFRPAGLLSASIQPPRTAYRTPEAVRELLATVLERAATAPGVQSAAFTSVLPLSGAEIRINFGIPGRPPSGRPGEDPVASMRLVSAGYLRTLGIRLVRGREFTDGDIERSPAVVLVNEALAATYWPGQDVLGRKVDVEMRDAVVVGVVADVRHAGPSTQPAPEMYLPCTQFQARSGWIVVRTSGDPASAAGSLRGAVRLVDPNLPLASIATMTQLSERSLAQPRFLAWLLAGFAGLAVLLTLFGIYSVLSFSVSRRTREIGVRMALGARRRTVMTMILAHSLGAVAAGAAGGLLASLALARTMRTLLFGVGPADPTTYIAVVVLITATALVASCGPARRAALVDPLVALRDE